MKTCSPKQQTIKVVEGNSFALLLPLKRRTYQSDQPIDEDINCSELEEVILTIGGQDHPVELGLDGVRVVVEDGLPVGTYDIILTAFYQGSSIRAAYFEGLRIVPWNYQGDAEQYLPGSPIVAEAAIIIGGSLTDNELSVLKQQYRDGIAATAEARTYYEIARQEYQEKAAAIDDIAQESTSQEILNAVGHIDFSELSKQGSNEAATNTAILDALKSAAGLAVQFPTATEAAEAAEKAVEEILVPLNND